MIRKSNSPFQWEIVKLNNEATVKYLKMGSYSNW